MGMVGMNQIGNGLVGAGAALSLSSFIPEGAGVLPADVQSSALLVGGAGLAGAGAVFSIIGGK